MEYEVDFVMMCQTNLGTKQKRLVRVRPKNAMSIDGPAMELVPTVGQETTNPWASSINEPGCETKSEKSTPPTNPAEFTGSYRRTSANASSTAQAKPSSKTEAAP